MPTAVPTSDAMKTAANPIPSDTRAPKTTRAKTSRPSSPGRQAREDDDQVERDDGRVGTTGRHAYRRRDGVGVVPAVLLGP